MSENFDVAIIGSGPGGYVAAIRASQLGLRTALIEKEHLGGICLNWGCIPTKALLKSAEIFNYAKHAEEYGIAISKPSFNLDKIVRRSREVSKTLAGGIEKLMKKHKISLFKEYGKITDKNSITLSGGSKIITRNIIIATGARPRVIEGLEPDGKLVLTYKEAMTPVTIPKKLIIIGSGAIGIEFASFYNIFGSEVTVVEIKDRILLSEDSEIANLARKSFENQGIKFFTNAKTKKLTKGKNEISLTLEASGKVLDLKADQMIVAAGILGNTENVGLENTKVKIENYHIKTNNFMETDESGIFAIGDVTGAPWLAHKASHEAIIAVEKIAGLKKTHTLKRENIPGCIYSVPQMASIGLTEEAAKEKGYKIKVGRFPFAFNGKAIASGSTEGLIKTIFDAATGELLGAHIIGHEVTELIHSYAIAKNMECTEEDIINTIFPHPTLSEMIHESTLQAFDRAIHI